MTDRTAPYCVLQAVYFRYNSTIHVSLASIKALASRAHLKCEGGQV